jgi:hypothetical protein
MEMGALHVGLDIVSLAVMVFAFRQFFRAMKAKSDADESMESTSV